MNSAANRKVRLFSVALLLIAACGWLVGRTAWADCSQQKIFQMIVEDRSTAQISRECGEPQARRPSVFNFGEKGGEWVNAVTLAPGNGGGFLLVGAAWMKGSEVADGWAIRLDWKGKMLWERTFAGIGESSAAYVFSAPDGGYILAGNDETAFEVANNAWVIRLDKLGNTLWKRTYGGKYYDIGSAITVVPGGGYLLAGYTNSKGAGHSDAWAIRLDEKGNILWERTFGGTREDEAYAVIPADGNGGGFLLVGRTSSRGAGRSDAWAIRLDDEGNKIWDRAVGGSEWDVAYDVVRVPGEGYLLVGLTKSKGAGKEDAWAVRLDGRGNTLWERTFGDSEWDEAHGVTLVPGGGYLLVGRTRSKRTRDFDAWALRLDAKGNQLWQRTFGGNHTDLARSVIPLPGAGGGYLVAGITKSTVSGGYDAWVLKLDAQGRLE